MMIFAFPEQSALAEGLALPRGDWEWRHFPDGESYVRVRSDVKGKEAAILCSLNRPDEKALPLIFLAALLKEQGAAKVTLIAPYLGYMRQDIRFKPGEAVTSEMFAKLLSPYIDALVTVDPHLHRHASLEAIYTCECRVVTAAPLMAQWIKQQVKNPLIIGPDSESEQWVRGVAAEAGAPYVVLQKIRHGDRDVEIALPDMARFKGRTPVLVDDIISTAGTMVKVVNLLSQAGFGGVHCVATHGLFAGDAYGALQKAGTARIVTANTVAHASNGMDIAPLLQTAL